jgi:NADPH2:quinone reductase
VKRGGRVTVFGVAPTASKVEASPFDVYFRELKIVGTYALTKNAFRRAIYIINNKRIAVEQLITDFLPLERLNEAFAMMEKRVGLKKQIKL